MPDEGVQSPAGDQGTEVSTDSGSDLYDLGSVDPNIREQLEPHLKSVQSNVDKKFREAADYRKGWEPYEELGLRDVDPQEVKQLLDFAQLANDPDQFADWWKNAGEQMGLYKGTEELGLEEMEDLSPEKIEEMVSEKMAPLQEKIQAREQQEAVQEAGKAIESSLAQIRKDNPDLPEAAEDAIVKLAYSYAEEDGDPIAKGFEDYQQLVGQGEKGLFTQKSNQPAPAEGPGAASTGAEKITSFSDPKLKEMATERLRKSLST